MAVQMIKEPCCLKYYILCYGAYHVELFAHFFVMNGIVFCFKESTFSGPKPALTNFLHSDC